ncbi:MAG: hypothetical protein M3O41_13940 [Pseudomonadota bacterium]|nr:hypothetical protein [Pseudomonadota bacterium]
MNRSLKRALAALFMGAFADAAVYAGQATDMPLDDPAASMPDGHDMSHMSMSNADSMAPTDPMMMGALGRYSMNREASGTSWQPDSATHGGVHLMEGNWMLMGHALLNGVYDWQQGPRGSTDTFASGMLMGMARRHFERGDGVQFRAMLSPEPLMGKSGYPLLLATGESANGTTPLVDRQHPHDLFMELSGTYSRDLGPKDSFFFYGGLPGEPAFGPPAFMHRQSILDSPEAPISHHWLDSTHITYGVATLGYIHDDFKFEVSRFHGREPDQFRYNIEHGALDSTSARLSWNPTREWSLQASWAKQISPEQLQPDKNERRLSGSAIYTHQFGEHTGWSTTVAWGRRHSSGDDALNAYVLESALQPTDLWTAFARFEREKNNELIALGPRAGTAYNVAKTSIGAIRNIRLTEHIKVGAGALYAFNFLPETLAPLYGRTHPQGAMAFVRLNVD